MKIKKAKTLRDIERDISHIKAEIGVLGEEIGVLGDILKNVYGRLKSKRVEESEIQQPFDYKSIKTIEDAYKRNKKDYSKVTSNTKHIQAYIDLCEIAKAFNNDPNIENYEKYWYPYFRVFARSGHSTSAFGGVSSLYANNDSSVTGTFIGSRLAFNSKEKAKYAAEQFKDVYEDYILGKE